MRELNLPNNPFLVSEDEKKNVLAEDTPVYIIHKRVFVGMLNIVKKADAKFIYIKATEPFLNGSVILGDSVTCQIFNGEHEYRFYGQVSMIEDDCNGLVHIELNQAHKYLNLRRDKRYIVNFNTEILDYLSNKRLEGVIKNISLGGIALACSEPIDKQSNLGIKIPIDHEGKKYLEFKARILRVLPCINYREYGMVIHEIDDNNKEKLQNLIKTLEDNEKAVVEFLKR
ncbi:MAG: PilZ domain-containing protein [Clostridia bacterium]|nr:PilZ domain-containing protein [Clostridia bacterium]